MMTRGRRTSRALAVTSVIGAAALVASCSGGSQPADSDPDETVELSVLDYHTDEPSHSDTTARLEKCAAEVNATIDHQSAPADQLNAKILQQVSTHTLPDILMINNPDLPQFADTGALRPLEDLDVDTSVYYPSVLEVGTFDDKVYGLAPSVNSLLLYYNKTMLADAGVEVPATWAELADAAEKLTEGDRYGFAYAASSGTEGTWTFIPFLWNNGGSQLDLTAPEATEAVSFYTGLALDGYVSSSAVNWSQADAKDQFAAGRAAMMINGPWQMPSLNDTEGLEYATATIPVPEVGDTPQAPLGGEVWTVPVSTPDRERRAAAVVECLNSPELQLEAARSSFTVPSNQDAAQQLLEEKPEMESLIDTIASAHSLTSDSGLKWPDVNASLSTALQAVITGKSDVQTALETAQAEIDG